MTTNVSPDLPGMTSAATVPVDRLWSPSPGRVAGVIHGSLPNKANSRQIVMVPRVKGGDPNDKRPLVIKSKDARKYDAVVEKAVAESDLTGAGLPLEGVLYFKVVVYQADLRRDLDCELLPDLLQKHGVLKNDRSLWHKEYHRKIDKACPRVEFEVGLWIEGKETETHG